MPKLKRDESTCPTFPPLLGISFVLSNGLFDAFYHETLSDTCKVPSAKSPCFIRLNILAKVE